MLLFVGWTSRRRAWLAPGFRPAADSDVIAKSGFSDCQTVGISCFDYQRVFRLIGSGGWCRDREGDVTFKSEPA
jgi:hypothetical protein